MCDEPPRRNGGVAMELALRVDNKETTVPKLYPETLLLINYRPGPDPARRAAKMHDSEGVPRARKASHQPTGAAPATGLPRAEGAPLGAYKPTVTGRLDSATRIGDHHPIILAPSLIP
jgi:hypothetical protein